jgi:dihydroorotate dehydrogenase (fumarate)
MTTTPDLRTSLGGGKVQLSSAVYNASGPRSGTAAALHKVAVSQAGAVLTKSATLEAQTGNPQPRTWHSPDGLASLNSEGLPNNGIEYYIAESTIEECMESADKPFIVSLSGKTLDDNLEMLKRIKIAPTRQRISAIELNLACPNVIGKPIIAYDFDQMDKILTQVAQVGLGCCFGVKLPPYLDFQHFAQAAAVLNKHKSLVKYIVCINTIGNAFAIDTTAQQPVISSNQGFAGLSGPAVKYTALANVKKFRSLLDEEIDIVGVGGIQSGRDVFEFLLCGATACQVATCHWKEGPECFDRICEELKEIMKEHGYSSVADVKGRLNDWSKDGAALSRAANKKAKAGATGMNETGASDLQFYKTLCGFLVLLLAILCADRWTHVKLLPSEHY